MIRNEKIKAPEVDLTGLNGEKLGIVPTSEALEMARKGKADLVCLTLAASPPPCKLTARGEAKNQAKKSSQVKELRLTAAIEEHDYETKRRQAEKLLQGGDAVQLTIRLKGKEGPQAKELLERLARDLAGSGAKETGIQLSGKQAAVRLMPL
ncbi:translation initiation factor IF-3 [Paenibacillus aurantius]|uniref:Translation initiation factor IF-3 n=1 Tax=Paenibacillus aurantius TaxID=2918900 RepID=A0AA96REI2_9BACL|nr:translation initiation factor IF-3 [Paenibacillus aurantius]WNQ12475.1 translation initiation factor IF-3 [Paenibacillus aurantius]